MKFMPTHVTISYHKSHIYFKSIVWMKNQMVANFDHPEKARTIISIFGPVAAVAQGNIFDTFLNMMYYAIEAVNMKFHSTKNTPNSPSVG